MRRALLGYLLVSGLLAGCAYFGDRASPYRPPGVVAVDTAADGRTLYMRDCAWCHGNEGQGTENGPSLKEGTNGPAMTDFMLSTGRMPIDHPAERIQRNPSIYTPRDVEAIIGYMEGFDAPGPAIPELDLARGDIGEGAELYQDNCAACHASTGIGGALSVGGSPKQATAVAPPLNSSTPKEVAEAMLVGPGTMPVFGPETFTEDQVNSILRYVEYLRRPDNRGGLPMGRIGPWSEGAAAWILGLGPLILLIIWIGRKV